MLLERVLVVLVLCTFSDTIAEEVNLDWWKNAVFYQIYPRSFKDSDNDGIGDLKGITSKLQHLKDAGITAAWLSPIYESPQVDQGYDISNFTNIAEEYGTFDDFDNLVEKAHSLGIKIVMDFVPNHSSDKHPWFEKSENREEGYKDYYVWKNNATDGGPPNNWLSNFKYSAWQYSSKREQFYLHTFAVQQADLNYRSPLLVKEMKNVLKFWLDRGVDGFRMDAVPYLFEDEQFLDEPRSNADVPSYDWNYLSHIYTSDMPETFDMIYQWRQFLDDYSTEHGGDERIFMTESYTDIVTTMKYYGNSTTDGAHFTFNFQLITRLNGNSTAYDVVNAIQEWITNMPKQYTSNWVLGNHDNHRVATRFGPENVDAFNILTAFLPGVLVTYNGEEIGQEDGEVTFEEGHDPNACNAAPEDFDKYSRDFERTPFHWDNSINAGFNDGFPPWLPVSSKYTETNLKAQSVPGIKSHFHLYQDILKLRQEEVFTKGNLNIKALSNKVVAYTRSLDDGTTYIIVINISDQEENVDLREFSGINQNIKIISASTSSNKHDRVLSTNSFVVAPHEAVVAKSLSNVQMGNEDWWKHAVFYQIYPRSFKDDSNDGIGDLNGIISKLDHLKNAGITAAWFSPIYESPQVDQGYDISNFTNIAEEYGTYSDFDNLVKKAHSLGIKIVMDFVPNHSSDKHPWFEKSENREEGYEDYYVWKNNATDGGPPNNWLSNFKYSAWQYSSKREQFYLHTFAVQQPDLNYRSPLLVKEMKNVLKFWLDRGVDGFRMDAVPYLFEDERFLDEPRSNADVPSYDWNYLSHIYTSDIPETFDMIYQWRQFIDDYWTEHGGDERVFMTEAYTDIVSTMKYYGNSTTDGAHFTFNFQLITKLNGNSTAYDIVNAIQEWITNMPKQYTSNWVLGNHDNHRVATRFGPENVDAFNILTAFLPGVLVTYNGEEIGQENGEVTFEEGHDPSACNAAPEDFDKYSRDFERTPFHWDNSTNAGFNEGFPPWLPVSSKYTETNLKAQSVLGIKSHFHLYQDILKLRQEEVFTKGNFNIKALSNNVVAYTRSLDDGSTYIIVINISDQEENVDLREFSGINQNIKIISASTSSNKHDRVLSTNSFLVAPHEAVVAKSLSNVQMGNEDWWKHAVFYQIYPRSFKDDNNDGIGDLNGIISKLDHLKHAGITAAWLSPIYESPQVDQGYDISNFTNIAEEYGTFGDFDNLLKKAHSLGIKIVMDFVPNHSSEKHPWFEKSENREEGYEDYYVWKNNASDGGPPNNWLSNFKYSAWQYSSKRQQFYLHTFAVQQADLNYRSPLLVEEMKNVLKFWLDRGVDGFRMDAVPYMFEDERFLDEPRSNADVPSYDWNYLSHIYTSDRPETFDMIYQWRQLLDDYVKEHGGDERVIMTEAYTDIVNTMKYYGNSTTNGAHFTFNFQLITRLNGTSNAEDIVKAVQEWLNNMPSQYTSNWVLGNHDNHRVATRFGPQNVDGFNMFAAVLPGVLVTYNGEEIGQEDGEVTFAQGQDPNACNASPEDFDKYSRDFERTPFQWDNSTNAGFNDGFPPWLPVSSKYRETNLLAQTGKTSSHYGIYKQILQLRQENVFKNGDMEIFSLNTNVTVVIRRNATSMYVLLFNVGDIVKNVNLTNHDLSSYLEVVLVSGTSNQTLGDLLSTESLILQPHESILAVNTTRIPNDGGRDNAGVRFITSLSLLILLPTFLIVN